MFVLSAYTVRFFYAAGKINTGGDLDHERTRSGAFKMAEQLIIQQETENSFLALNLLLLNQILCQTTGMSGCMQVTMIVLILHF